MSHSLVVCRGNPATGTPGRDCAALEGRDAAVEDEDRPHTVVQQSAHTAQRAEEVCVGQQAALTARSGRRVRLAAAAGKQRHAVGCTQQHICSGEPVRKK